MTSEPGVTFVTDFADQAVMLPVLAAIAVVLGSQRQWRAAWLWLIAVGGALGVMLLLKVSVSACGWQAPVLGPGQLGLRSPSGHTAAAAAIAGGVAALIAPGRFWLAVGVSLLAAALIGTTRLLLGVHSLAEVLVGGAVGVAGAGLLAWLARPVRFRVAPVLAAVVVAMILFHGRHLPAEAAIQGRGATLVRAVLPACVPPPNPADALSHE